MVYLVKDYTTLDGVIYKRLDIPRLVNLIKDEIIQQTSFQSIVSILKDIIPYDELEYSLFAIIVNSVKHSTFKEPISFSAIRKLYFEFKKYLKNDYFYFISIIPLYNFRSDVESIRFSNELQIRKISKEEKEKFLNSSRDNIFFFDTYEYVIEIKHKAQRGSMVKFPPTLICHEYGEINRAIKNVLSSLRLYKTGFIGYQYIFEMIEIPYVQMLSTHTRPLTTGLANYPYYITIEQFGKVIEIFKKLNEKDQNNSTLDSTIDIFNSMYERNNHYDSYVNIRYILQVLLSKTGENEQNYFKISRRLSRFVSFDVENRLVNANIIKGFFDLYPKIINKMRLKRKDIMIIKSTQYLVRKAVLNYMYTLQNGDKGNLHSDFVDRMDYQL
jgi:hypothetical protein